MREDYVANGVKFLTHPNVQTTPLSQRAEFLEKKGLQQDEIQEAIRRAESKEGITTTATTTNNIVPIKNNGWKNVLLSAAGILGAGTLIHFLWKQSEALQQAPSVDVTTVSSSSNDDIKQLTSAIQEQTTKMEQFMMAVKEKEKNEQKRTQSMAQEVAELSMQIAKLNDALGSRTKAEEEEEEKEPIDYYGKMETAFRQLHQQNTSEAFQGAAGILSMYVKNLIEHSDKPRYRRISMANANFKQNVLELKGHEEFLETIGFVKRGVVLEWQNEEVGEKFAILEASLKALDMGRKGDTSIDLICEQAEKVYKNKSSQVIQEEEEEETVATSNDIEDQFQNFISKLKPAIAESPKIELIDEEELKPSAEEEEEAGKVEPSPEPVYPKSFTEVVKMVQNGEQVPGIEHIEEKLSIDALNPTPSHVSPPKKPWTEEQHDNE